MIESLLYIKHKFSFIWKLIEFFNGMFVNMIWGRRILASANDILGTMNLPDLKFRVLYKDDLVELFDFLKLQPEESFKYFKPHGFDIDTLRRLYGNPSFLMMGVFQQDNLIGYFFLRFFINKHAFTGRIVDYKHQGLGIAKCMGKIMFQICWNNNFRIFGTASKENTKSLKSYKSINDFRIIKELDNGYIYFEYLKDKEVK